MENIDACLFVFVLFVFAIKRKKRMNLYGPPQSNQDFIDNQLSIDVSVLVHSSVGVVCACVCVFVYVCA